NMIPEGLILLTSSVLALATIRLSKKQVLVQDFYAIETLARVDTIALDKTGTLTTGNMTVHDFILPDGTTLDKPSKSPTPAEKSFLSVLNAILSHQTAENATTTALKRKFLKTAKNEPTEQILEIISFSSERKHSGIRTKDAAYLLGAIDFVTDDPALVKQVKSASGPYRTLAVVKLASQHPKKTVLQQSAGASSYFDNGRGRESGTEIPGRVRPTRCENNDCEPRTLQNGFLGCELLGFIRLEDEIRPDAKQIINYFYDNDIDVRIISGDDLDSVKNIASRVGVKDLRGINLSDESRPNYNKLVKDYAIFTRVTPNQKKELIKALKKQGSTVAMTGDGVNDILAMKEADASLAIGEGSDAARRAAKFVLLDSGFESVPSIIDEGRQSINNLERSTSLFLAKTVYASILAVIFVILPFSYPFSPIEMSLLNFACIGFPGLILALEHNTERIKNRFTKNIIEYSVPIGLTVSICMLALSVISHFQNFSRFELTTTSVFIAFAIDLVLIYWISRPLNKLRSALLISIIVIMAAAFLIPFARDFFEFTFLSSTTL
ncbi:HAD-IC family P-type ATPase, partial [Candidatus Saccharibacteria bacterium]|nr:HAD-IC family P-type ATPase [Candidatus Saccharibacteria bacterium]